MKLLFLISALLASANCFAQQSKPMFTHKLHGTIKDPQGAAICGLRIVRNGVAFPQSVTTANGDFSVDLTPGDYVLTIEPESLYPFRAFIKIIENGLNPDNVAFELDTNKACCSSSEGVPFPKLLLLPKPGYPAAAAAVRATGEVIVAVKIDSDGKVTTAKAQNGHPLLRVAAEQAARGSRFEPSEVAEREARLFYMFINEDDKPRNGVTTYTNAYMVWIVRVSPGF